MMAPRDLAAYLALAVIWGLSFLLLVKVVEAFGWVGAVSLRCFVASGGLYAAARAMGRPLAFHGGWQPFFVVGATTVALQLIGLSYGTPLIGTAMAAILVATIPLFSMVIAHIWGLERISRHGLAGLGLGILGIILLVGFPPVPMTPEFLIGCGATLVASAAAAFGSNYAGLHLRQTGPWEVTIGAFFFGGLMTLPLLALVPLPCWPGWRDWVNLAILGAGMSAFTYALYFRLVANIGATRAISVEFAVTIVAVMIGGLILGEPLSVVQLSGAGIIILGCSLVLGLVGARQAQNPHH